MKANREVKSAWALVADSSWLAGQTINLPDSEVIIGRDKTCDITLPGAHLSRQHAQLGIWNDQLHIKDLNSANGTFINGRRITQGRAKPGDQVRFDVYSFTLQGPGQNLEPNERQEKNQPVYRDPTRPKHWKLAPTSPGNREEPTYNEPKIKPLTLISIILCVAMLAVFGYLLINAF